MSLRVWDERVVPRLTDLSLRGHEVGEMREVGVRRADRAGARDRLRQRAQRAVVPARGHSVTAIEPSDLGWQLSERRRARTALPIERAGLDGQRLDLPDDSHDSALVTFSLCTIPDPLLALREARRVVRPGGRLHVLEHGLAPDESVRRWQRRMEPLQRAVPAAATSRATSRPSWRRRDGASRSSSRRTCPDRPCRRPWTYGYRLVAG